MCNIKHDVWHWSSTRRKQPMVVQDEQRHVLLPQIVNWLDIKMNVIVLDMGDPMKCTCDAWQAIKGEDIDMMVLDYSLVSEQFGKLVVNRWDNKMKWRHDLNWIFTIDVKPMLDSICWSKSLGQGKCAQINETNMDGSLKWIYWSSMEIIVFIFDLEYINAMLSRGMHHKVSWKCLSAQVTYVSWRETQKSHVHLSNPMAPVLCVSSQQLFV